MRRKITIIIIIAVLLFSSCSKENDTENNDNNHQQSETITFGFIGLQPATNDASSVSNRVHEKILNDFGINIQVITLNENTWKQELDEMISKDQLPDVFFHDVTDAPMQYRQLIDLGLIRDIPKSMWAQKENLGKVMSWYENNYALDNKMYFVPRTYQTYDQTHGSSYAILYRRDWAYVVDSIPPQDPHFYDVMEMVKAFVAKDPDKNDVKDTWGITGGNDLDFINYAFLQPFGVREWMYEDGKWIPGLLSNEAKESVAWLSQLYKEGIIDPDFTQQTSEEALNKFITGKSGACLASIYPEQLKNIEEKWLTYNSNSIYESVDIIPLYFAPSGFRYNEVETFTTGTMFSANLKDKDMEKVLNLMDWMYSEEGRMYFEYGIENDDYSIVLGDIVPKGGTEEAKFFSERNIEYKPLENLVSWNLDYSSFYLDMMTEFQTYGKKVLENDIWAYSYESELFTKGMLTPEVCVLNIETVARDMLFEVIMTSSDFEAEWNEYVDYCKKTFNVNEASQEVAQRANELGITP